ncbi:MAG: hypothetical protein JNM39_15045 [Bdellovibrionaceae bacterium]|nr:hypothetical protein [Pseudobdellovibrionaceae bacterium]
MKSILLLLSIVGGSAFADIKPLEIRTAKMNLVFKTTAIASLVYQVDCLAGLIYCEEKLVKDFWKTQNWTADDDTTVKAWSGIFERYGQNSESVEELSPEIANAVGFPIRNNSVTFDKKFRMASFISQNLASYRNAISLLMVPADVEKAASVIQHFRARHLKWWNKEGSKHTQAFAQEFAKILKKKNLIPFVEQVASFYEAELSAETPIFFHFFYLPGQSKHSSGEQIENHSCIEFLQGEKIEDRIDVVLHELFHYFYRSVGAQKHAEFVKSFAQNSEVSSIAAYNLLNEVLATAFGNGMIFQKVSSKEEYAKRFAKERTFYNDYAIDTVAKALIPHLEKNLVNKVKLYDKSFVDDYIQVVKSALHEKVLAPKLALRTMVAIYQYGVEFSKDLDVFSRQIRSGSTWSSHEFESEKSWGRLKNSVHLSGLLLLKAKDIELLKPLEPILGSIQLAKIRERAKRESSFVFTIPRSYNSWIFVVVANPGEDAQRLLTQLADAEKVEDLK